MPLLTGVSDPLQIQQNQQALAAQRAPAEPDLEKHYAAYRKAKALGYDDVADAIQQRIQATTSKLQDQEATRGMSSGDLFTAGAGAGAQRIRMGVRELLSGGGDPNSPDTLDRIRAEKQLQGTDAGILGDVVGEQAALAPVTMMGGSLLKTGAKALGTAAPAVARVLSSPSVRAGVEGALAGGVSANPGDRLEGAGYGAGGAVALTKTAQGLRRLYTGPVEPSAAANRLRKQGVDLTLGQMNPGGKFNQLEEASESVGGIGATIKGQRQAGRESFQDAALRKGLPPGMPEAPARAPDNMASRLDQVYQGFDPAYRDAVKGQMVYPATHGKVAVPLQTSATGKSLGVFDLAVNDPSVTATDAERAAAKKFLDGQLSILPGGTTRPNMLAQVPAEDVQTIRSNLRARIRQEANSGGNGKIAELLKGAEQKLGDVFDTQLTNPDRLRDVDRQYARYKTVEGAQAQANGRPGDFTPNNLLNSAQNGLTKSAFARGRGGDMLQLALDGRRTLDSRSPTTGARLLSFSLPAAAGWLLGGKEGAAAGGFLGPSLTAAGVAGANKAPVKSFLTGGTAPQKAMQGLEAAVRRGLGPTGRVRAQDLAYLTAALLGKGAGNAVRQEDF